jgi:hypothetical protein
MAVAKVIGLRRDDFSFFCNPDGRARRVDKALLIFTQLPACNARFRVITETLKRGEAFVPDFGDSVIGLRRAEKTAQAFAHGPIIGVELDIAHNAQCLLMLANQGHMSIEPMVLKFLDREGRLPAQAKNNLD